MSSEIILAYKDLILTTFKDFKRLRKVYTLRILGEKTGINYCRLFRIEKEKFKTITVDEISSIVEFKKEVLGE